MLKTALGPSKQDIVISGPRKASGPHLLGTISDQAQLTCADYDEAVTHAFSYARTQSVDVWIKRGSRSFERLEAPVRTSPAGRPVGRAFSGRF